MDLKNFLTLGESKDSIVQKLEYLKKTGVQEYKKEALALMSLKRFPTKAGNQIIEQIIPKSINEYD